MSDEMNVVRHEDWARFAQRFDCVIDPMMARTVELFLNGRSGCIAAGLDEGQTWAAIDKNIGSLLAFFNLLISRDALPLIRYFVTFGGEEMDRPGAKTSIVTLLDSVDNAITSN